MEVFGVDAIALDRSILGDSMNLDQINSVQTNVKVVCWC